MKVKVILTETIKGVGKKDEIVEFKDWYANNFLYAQKKGIPATEENIKKLDNKKAKVEKTKEKETIHANDLKKQLEAKPILLEVKMGKDNKLFGSIGSKEIEEAIKEQLNIEVDKKKMGNDARIKTLGDHIVEIKLYADVKANVKVIVKGV